MRDDSAYDIKDIKVNISKIERIQSRRYKWSNLYNFKKEGRVNNEYSSQEVGRLGH